jgi:hypothetical protein
MFFGRSEKKGMRGEMRFQMGPLFSPPFCFTSLL